MAHMRGVLCLAAGQRGLRVEPMTATMVKQRVTGNGRASKLQVQEMVLRLCGIEPREMRADISDAIALAVAGLNQIERGLPAARSPRALLRAIRQTADGCWTLDPLAQGETR
jgi:crossover junction endodeoxyribonuclease RuvC